MTRIRKQDYHLEKADLTQFPVWEYALDEEEIEGQDERTVRPYLVSSPLDPRKSHFIVRASFDLADGTLMKGLVTPRQLDSSEFTSSIIPYDLHPTIITEQGRVHFCYGVFKPDSEKIARNYRMLGKKSPLEVFPMKFASDVKVLNSVAEGVLPRISLFRGRRKEFSPVKVNRC